MVMKAATLFDQAATAASRPMRVNTWRDSARGVPHGHADPGGMGYAQEYHVERSCAESLIPRTAPVSPHLILSYLPRRSWNCPSRTDSAARRGGNTNNDDPADSVTRAHGCSRRATVSARWRRPPPAR